MSIMMLGMLAAVLSVLNSIFFIWLKSLVLFTLSEVLKSEVTSDNFCSPLGTTLQ